MVERGPKPRQKDHSKFSPMKETKFGTPAKVGIPTTTQTGYTKNHAKIEAAVKSHCLSRQV